MIPCWCHKCFYLGAIVTTSVAHCWHSDVMALRNDKRRKSALTVNPICTLLHQPDMGQFHLDLQCLALYEWLPSSPPSSDVAAQHQWLGGLPLPTDSLPQMVYNSKWHIFSKWCWDANFNSVSTTTPILAEFLTHLFTVENFAPVTIAGYCTTVINTLEKVTSSCLYDEHLRTSLLNQFEAERPRPTCSPLTWDLALVLHVIHGPPFEPLAQAPLWALTCKSVFPTAVATAKRCSELHSFSYKIQHKEDWSSITLQPDPLFVAKMEKANRPETCLQEVYLWALAPFMGPDLPTDANNCVVRALKIYLARSWTFCKGRKRLFISYKSGHSEEIKPATISCWIVKTIRYVYDHCSENLHDSSRPRLMTFVPLPLAECPSEGFLTRHPPFCSVAFPQHIHIFLPDQPPSDGGGPVQDRPGGHCTACLQCCSSFDLALSTMDYSFWHGLVFCLDWKFMTRHICLKLTLTAWSMTWLISVTWDFTSLTGGCLFIPLWACLQHVSIPPALSHMCPLGLTVSAVLWLFFDPADCGYHTSFLLTEPISSRIDSVS